MRALGRSLLSFAALPAWQRWAGEFASARTVGNGPPRVLVAIAISYRRRQRHAAGADTAAVIAQARG